MRLSPRRTTGQQQISLPMTPMIDIIFQLIIFFLCTMKFRSPEAQQNINLPGEGQARSGVTAAVPDVPLVLRRAPGDTPDREDYVPQIRLGDAGISSWKGLLESLKVLKLRNPEIRIVIDPGPDVIHDSVVKAIDQCAGADIRNVGFAKPRPAR